MREPVKYGDYYLFERVAVGGMAEVFKGVSYGVEGFERLFAVKRVLPNISEDQEFIEMFIDEAKIAVQLTHANIGQIFELGKNEGAYFIAMEFVQGKDLRAIWDRARNRGQRLDIAMCCHIIKEVCEALEYAHSKKNERHESLNLVHRDVSPQNIIVSYDGEVKLIDFGIAKAAGKASKTQAGILKGKFGYMSPEQVRGKPIDRRSDLFSLAVVLYELLTLERCFQGESDFSTLEKVRNVDIRRPAAINRDIPPELERIVLRGLSRNPDDRYQSASELQDALQKFLYQSGSFYARKDLSGYMRRQFDRELRDEQHRMGEFRDYAGKHIPEARRANSGPASVDQPAEPSKPDLPALSWEEDELETAVWDRSPSQVMRGVEPERPMTPPRAAPAAPEPAFVQAGLGAAATPSPRLAKAGAARTPPPRAPQGPGPGAGPLPADLDLPRDQFRRRDTTRQRLAALLLVALLAVAAGVLAIRNFSAEAPTGTLVIDTKPVNVQLYLDGQRMHDGATPVKLAGLAPGEHRVKVVGAGYEAVEQLLTIAGGEERALSIELPPEKKITALTVETTPGGAKVYVDGKLIDRTPLRTEDVTAGKRQVRVEMPGYLPWSATVDVQPAVENKLPPVKLAPETVTVAFLPEPDDARITLTLPDGKKVTLDGAARYEVPNKGGVTIRVERSGYEPTDRALPQYFERRATEVVSLSARAEVPDPAPRAPVAVRPARRPDPAPVRRPPPREDPDPPDEDGPCRGEDCPPQDGAPIAADPEAPPPPPPAPKQNGFLKLMAKPPGRAFINGKDVGWTPLLKHPLPPGTHTVTLVREEPPTYRGTISVVIEEGETTFRKYP